MIELFRTPTLSEAYALQTALTAEGIDSFIQGELTIAIIAGGVSVRVNEHDLVKAKAVLAEFRRS